ncbi:hypothetical protein ACFL5V_04275 [Fibrobacterota bacterium]
MVTDKPDNRLSSYGRMGVLLTAMGVLLAVDALANLSLVYKLWPLLVSLLGAGFIGIHLNRPRQEGIYIGLGVFFLGLSLLLLYCSLFSWADLDILWPVFIILLGVSFCFAYAFGKRDPFLLLAGLLLISIAIVFFFVFGLTYKLWWTIFLLAGSSLLIYDRARRS